MTSADFTCCLLFVDTGTALLGFNSGDLLDAGDIFTDYPLDRGIIMRFSLRRGSQGASNEGDAESTESIRNISIEEIAKRKDLSLYEKKCVLVNRQVDAMGLGRYQYCLIGLCGLGYFM